MIRWYLPGTPPGPLVAYGWTCFSCRTTLDVMVTLDLDRRPPYNVLEAFAGRMGWCIGHWDGQGQYVCPRCKDSIWDARRLA